MRRGGGDWGSGKVKSESVAGRSGEGENCFAAATMPMTPTIRYTVLLSAAGIGVVSGQEKVTYQDHVRPILENRCLNCHNADKKKGGLDMSTFMATMAGGSGGVSIEPGDAQASKLFQVVVHSAEPFMPPKSDKIPAAEAEVIAKWIAGGVLETASSSAKAKKKAEFAMSAGGTAGKPEGPAAMPEHLSLQPVVTPVRANAVTAMAHSPWAPLLALAAPKQVLLYHSETRELLGVLAFPEGGFPENVTFTRNGALVLASGGIGGKKGTVAVWDVKTGKRVITLGEEFDSIAAADITPDYSKIAIGSREKRVKIYDTASGALRKEIKKHTDWLTAVAFSPDGVLLATGDRNGGLYVWETETGGEFYNLKGHEKMVGALAWRGDSNLVASGSEDGNWIWWEMVNGTQVKKQASHGGVLALHFAPDGRMVSGGRDGHARIWDANGAQARDWVPSAGQMVLRTVFTQEGKTVVTGAWNGEVKVWDAAKDGDALGFVLYNPPSIEMRIEQVTKEMGGLAAAAEKAAADYALVEKVKADAVAVVEAATKAIAETTAMMEAGTKAVEGATAEVAKLTEAKKGLAVEGEAVAKRAAEAGAAVVPAAALPAGAAGELKESMERAAAAEASLDAMTKAVIGARQKGLAAAVAQTDAGLAAAQAALKQQTDGVAALKGKLDVMNAELPKQQMAVAEADKALAAAKPGLDAAVAAAAGPKRALQYWQAQRENQLVIALRDETAAMKEKVADLQAEIPALEASLKAIGEKKAAVPAPAAEELAKLEKQLATETARLDEARKELAALAPQLPEKEKAVEAGWQKYLGMLPK